MDIIYFNSLMIGVSLLAVSLAILGILAGLLYYGLRLSTRVSDLERGQLAFQGRIIEQIEEALKKSPKIENPGHEVISRRDQLLANLKANVISRTEAIELNDILVKEKEAAEKRGDFAALIAIMLGLALLAAVLAKSK